MVSKIKVTEAFAHATLAIQANFATWNVQATERLLMVNACVSLQKLETLGEEIFATSPVALARMATAMVTELATQGTVFALVSLNGQELTVARLCAQAIHHVTDLVLVTPIPLNVTAGEIEQVVPVNSPVSTANS